ncbi:MAG: UMP kinase [Firmicutes bacterium]|nr:UMP kinase [Bacillota bacterium]
MQYHRIMLKLSGEALAGDKGTGFDEATARGVARQVKEAHDTGIEIGIVIGAGNFWRGRSSNRMDRVKADQIGMLATVMNCLYAAEIFRTEGMETAIYAPYPIGPYTQTFNKDLAIRDMREGKIVFFAGGTGHPYFSTDMAIALRAVETECDVMLFAKNVDGVYDDDPNLNPNARKYDEMTYHEILAKGLKVMDLPAAALSMENHMPAVLFALKEDKSIIRVVNGEKIGTTIVG